jgi:hypothetical protein
MAFQKLGTIANRIVQKLRPHQHQAAALAQQEEWKCLTCNSPAQEDSQYCRSCELYWQDVRNGLLLDDDFED